MKLQSYSLLHDLPYTTNHVTYVYRDGVELSGLFCSANCVIEQLKVDQEVNVFNVVKQVRLSRPQFITNLVSQTSNRKPVKKWSLNETYCNLICIIPEEKINNFEVY